MDFLVKSNQSFVTAASSSCPYDFACPKLNCGVNCPTLSTGCMIKLN
jgi:hypothetical protein